MSEVIIASANPLYRRTLRLVVAVAAQIALPDRPLKGGHTVGEGYFYRLVGGDATAEELKKINAAVQDLVVSGDAITRVRKTWKEALAYFERHQLTCARDMLQTRVFEEVECYEVRGVLRLAIHPVYERCAALKAAPFDLVLASRGFIATYAKDKYIPQPALLDSHNDHINFGDSLNVDSVGQLNALGHVGSGRKDFMMQCEFRQEAKLAGIAAAVEQRKKDGKAVKVICIAGPTSSGKTTFANKLCMYLRNCGFVARPLTVDHYYLPLDKQPKYQARQLMSDVDFDHIESMDVELVGQHLNDIANGKAVMTPNYDMKSGYRMGEGHKFDALPANGVLVIEGIHALNPLYTQTVPAEKVFKIFISPLTALQLDDHNTVKSTDHRLLRRMCRDSIFRGKSASTTLRMWDAVRRGEGVWIFPHQNAADFVMNSAADYEIPVLKTLLEPLLREVTPDDANYAKAKDLLMLLDRFSTWPPHLTLGTSLLREFIGDGDFDCH